MPTTRTPSTDRSDAVETEAADRFEQERARLIGLAYRILGSRTDAEDVVQDAWLRFVRADPTTVDEPAAWLTTVVSRLALDQLRSARHRREAYVGPWLPDFVRSAPRTDLADDPQAAAELAESLTIGFLRVLDILGPTERVVFLLADVFDVPHAQIAEIIDRSPTASRQIASRARRRVRAERPVDDTLGTPNAAGAPARDDAVLGELVTALASGEVDQLMRLLAPDAVLRSDGGAAVRAARRPVVGPERIARFMTNLTHREGLLQLETEITTINSRTGIVLHRRNAPYMAVVCETDGEHVTAIDIMRNPDKLTALDFAEPVRRRTPRGGVHPPATRAPRVRPPQGTVEREAVVSNARSLRGIQMQVDDRYDTGMGRRGFLRLSAGAAMAATAGAGLTGCLKASVVTTADHGALLPADANGLQLPAGFTSRVVATTGELVAGTGYTWHIAPDGGACYPTATGGWIYVSNCEWYPGGAGSITFDSTGAIVGARRILDNTLANCAGGATPWGTWLSGEEYDAGQIFECDPTGVNPGVARPAMGRFKHEAAAVDPVRGHVYLTEDTPTGCLYRFLPTTAGDLSAGTLEVLVEGPPNALSWVTVPNPQSWTPTPTRDQVPGAKRFNGGEGICFTDDCVWFTTKGDNRVWFYDIALNLCGPIYDDSTSPAPQLTGVDNITVRIGEESGAVWYVAEDGADMEIVGVQYDGKTYPLCRLTGVTGSEITGPAFSPDGSRLYFSSQRNPGRTYEITGPFLPNPHG